MLWLTALRTLLHIAAVAAFFAALRFLPLADAVAIAFVMPFLLLLLGRLVLEEEVGARRLAACAVGFLGTLLVIQPSFAAVGAPALLPLVVAVLFALFMLVTRQIARDADPVALQAASGAMATVVLVPLVALADGRGWPGLDPVAAVGGRLGPPAPARRPRDRRAPAADLVAALRALRDPRADAVPRDPLRHPGRLAGLRRPAGRPRRRRHRRHHRRRPLRHPPRAPASLRPSPPGPPAA